MARTSKIGGSILSTLNAYTSYMTYSGRKWQMIQRTAKETGFTLRKDVHATKNS